MALQRQVTELADVINSLPYDVDYSCTIVYFSIAFQVTNSSKTTRRGEFGWKHQNDQISAPNDGGIYKMDLKSHQGRTQTGSHITLLPWWESHQWDTAEGR